MKKWIPTDKWVASAATGLGAVVATWVNTGAFDKEERSMLATLIPALIAAYFVSNKDRLKGVVTE